MTASKPPPSFSLQTATRAAWLGLEEISPSRSCFEGCPTPRPICWSEQGWVATGTLCPHAPFQLAPPCREPWWGGGAAHPPHALDFSHSRLVLTHIQSCRASPPCLRAPSAAQPGFLQHCALPLQTPSSILPPLLPAHPPG